MSTRRAKQIIYGMLYLILWAAFFGLVYLAVRIVAPPVAPPPPCTSACEPASAAPIATSTVWSFISSPGHYTFLTQIVDTDTDYTATYLTYDIDLYDASGTVVKSLPEVSFVYAGQTKYLVVPNVAVSTPFVTAQVHITQAYWAANSTLGTLPSFTAENIQTSNDPSVVTVSGDLTNANISATRYVYVDVIFNGPDGAPNGASQTELNNVAPGQTTRFSVIYPQTGSISPATAQVLVYGFK